MEKKMNFSELSKCVLSQDDLIYFGHVNRKFYLIFRTVNYLQRF